MSCTLARRPAGAVTQVVTTTAALIPFDHTPALQTRFCSAFSRDSPMATPLGHHLTHSGQQGHARLREGHNESVGSLGLAQVLDGCQGLLVLMERGLTFDLGVPSFPRLSWHLLMSPVTLLLMQTAPTTRSHFLDTCRSPEGSAEATHTHPGARGPCRRRILRHPSRRMSDTIGGNLRDLPPN